MEFPIPAADSHAGRVLLHHQGPVSVVTLNRPERRNALSRQMVCDLIDALVEADGHDQTAAIVLTGTGSAFCSGDDLSEAARTDTETFDETIEGLQRVTRVLLTSDKPSVAAINGAAMGGGLELTLACDLRMAGRDAVFACPEVAWGLVCTNGASVLLPSLVGHGRARDMLLTGRTYDATWALAAGLVSEVLPGDQVLDRAVALGAELASRAQAVRLTRRLISDGGHEDLLRALEREAVTVGEARRTDVAETNLREFEARRARREARS
ncbi:enoyl-CoA hydratase/isomerase family protein [Nonomuraea turcica]|uniref:enoyl-CoA hydratase/isomerase family protein n=1 Tax=Nonomuraea sp. G32 TaxID=3067274 RepID=UPI00273BB2D4|nr:enoyl-CoA hydratase/isomerase family protein [Nonomuraea sp. G32]MDP4505038.1 enoyl-CoA hydratase/isomerase family protein [Nonomuraea sp. G32]